jgi:hypothetical protein
VPSPVPSPFLLRSIWPCASPLATSFTKIAGPPPYPCRSSLPDLGLSHTLPRSHKFRPKSPALSPPAPPCNPPDRARRSPLQSPCIELDPRLQSATTYSASILSHSFHARVESQSDSLAATHELASASLQCPNSWAGAAPACCRLPFLEQLREAAAGAGLLHDA